MRPPRELVIGEDGGLSPSAGAAALLAGHAGRYRIIEGSPGVLILQRADGRPLARARVLMTGELIGKTTVLELVSMIMHNGWRGELTLHGSVTRRLTFDQSALRAASSELATERLGEVMEALGLITAEQRAQCAVHANPDQRFGEAAVARGFLDQQQLFAALQAQAERIFLAGLLMTSGNYVFALPGDDAEAPPLTLHLPVQVMLFEAVQRIDEMAHFRERIPNGEMRPVLTEAAGRLQMAESLRPVAALADGHRSILQIGRALHMGEFEVTKRVMQLLQTGSVELKEQQSLDEAVRRIVGQLNEMLQEIRGTVERHAGDKGLARMLWTLQTWARDADLTEHFGKDLDFSRDIPAEPCLEQLAAARLERPLETLHRTAHELISFAMFCASPALPREVERGLSKWINQRIAKMRI